MTRSAGTKLEQNFVNGLVTEATGLNFPENACTDALNVTFDVTGKVRRRKGLDFENSYAFLSVPRDEYANVEFLWYSVAGVGEVNYLVHQIGNLLYFYKVQDTVAISGNYLSTIDINTYKVTGAPSVVTEPCSFSSGKGYLFVTHPYCEPFYISVNTTTNAITGNVIQIQTRDLIGVTDDTLVDADPEYRPSTLSDAHRYNLRNQGWETSVLINSGAYTDTVAYYFTANAKYPSNSEQYWWTRYVDNTYYPYYYKLKTFGNVLAPRGHFVMSPFLTTRSSQTGVSGSVAETNSSYFRPSCTAFFAGRVWYAGVNYGGFGNQIYYSQIIERDSQFGKCYQLNDPTSEQLSDLLDTDGGVAKILDIGTVHFLFSSQKALLIFASNGVWSISGSDVTPFKATDYTIRRISSVGVDTAASFVDVLGTPVFWNNDGIWTVAYQQGDYTVTSLSDERIAQYYKEIPSEAKKWAKGAYNPVDKIIQWIWSTEVIPSSTLINQRYQYDRALFLNTKTGAFYPWSLNSSGSQYPIIGIFSTKHATNENIDYVIDSLGNYVVDSLGNRLIVGGDLLNTFMYIVAQKVSTGVYNITLAFETRTDYTDWVTAARSTDYSSYFLSGYKVDAEGNKEFQNNYVTFFLEDATNSSCFVRGLWDYSNSVSSGKWSTAQQIYLSSPSYRDYHIRKVKVRGWGKALQYRIYSDTGKPFNIVGWSAFETANSMP